MRLKSYAKINLGLRVLDPRPDGYHNIETIMQSIDLHDDIEIEEAGQGISVRCHHPLVPDDEANLASKAARLLQQAHGISAGARISIDKVIPVGAGLGGGSSNAAAVLQGLARLWKTHLSEQQLHHLAGQIGSDVPFFLKGGTALVTGRGEKLEYLGAQWDQTAFLLIYPRIVVSSAWAYAQVKNPLTRSPGHVNFKGLWRTGSYSPGRYNALFENDLEKEVGRTYPVIGLMREALMSAGASVSAMTGSGSTVFGIFPTWEKAGEAAQQIHHPEWDLYLSRPIDPGQEER